MANDNRGFEADPETMAAIQRSLQGEHRYDGATPGTSAEMLIDWEATAAESGDGSSGGDGD